MSAAGIAATNASVAADGDLVAAVRLGDDAAFGELYRRHHPAVNGFVRRLVRDHGRSEDVTQEAFVSALRRLRQTDTPIDFKPWIYEIARNASIDLYRRGRRAQEISVDFDSGMASAEVARLPGPGGAESVVLDRERFDHLRGALDELSDTHHQIIVLRELEGLSYREIGARMNLSAAAVESALFRARRKLEHEYTALHTGRRCRAILTAIARLAEGVESERDRRRLDRHARRCSNCRRQARALGVEPMLARRTIAARVAALLPVPAFLRRRPLDGFGDVPNAGASAGAGAHGVAAPLIAVGPVSVETAAAVGGKAAAMIATVALVGGGGAATLGAKVPLQLPIGGPSAVEKRIAEVQAETPPVASDSPASDPGAGPEPMLPTVSTDPPTFASPAGPLISDPLAFEPPSAAQPPAGPPAEPPAVADAGSPPPAVEAEPQAPADDGGTPFEDTGIPAGSSDDSVQPPPEDPPLVDPEPTQPDAGGTVVSEPELPPPPLDPVITEPEPPAGEGTAPTDGEPTTPTAGEATVPELPVEPTAPEASSGGAPAQLDATAPDA